MELQFHKETLSAGVHISGAGGQHREPGKEPIQLGQRRHVTDQVLINDVPLFTSDPIAVEMSGTSKINHMYFQMLEGINFTNKDIGITPTMFRNGYTLIIVDTTRDRSSSCNYITKPLMNAKMTIRFWFSKPTTENITLFLLTETDALLHIDSNHFPRVIE